MTVTIDAPGRELLERWIFVLVRVGAEFEVPYGPAARARIAERGGYDDGFGAFLQRVLDALGAAPWRPGSYFPGGLYRSLQGQGRDPRTVPITPDLMARFYEDEVRVDANGRWLVGPKQMQGRVLQHFLRNLEFDPQLERYRIRYWLERHYETRYIHPLSPPYRVVSLNLERMTALLNDGTEEPLHLDTLRMDDDEQLTLAVKPAGLPALLASNPRWQILQHAEQRRRGWVLVRPTGEIPLPLLAPRPYAGDVRLLPRGTPASP